MGCCYSFFCKEDGTSQNGEPNERTHLLVDPVSNNLNIPQISNGDYLSQNSDVLPKKTDEQSALNRILQETATNVIDVAALDSHNLQQHEYLERMKQYSVKLQQACSTNKVPKQNRMCILEDIPTPEKVLAQNSVTEEDVNFITNALVKATAAISDIKIEHKEDLVVPFHIV